MDAETATIIGIACHYGIDHSSSRPGIALDRLAAGCFAASLANQPTALCRMHNHGVVYAATYAFPWWLEVFDDAAALAFRYIVPVDDPQGLTLWREIRAGGLPEASIGFRPTRTELQKSHAGQTVRVIHEADLAEISVVTSGAIPGTATRALGAGAARLDIKAALSGGLLATAACLAEADVSASRLMAAADRLDRKCRPQATEWPTAVEDPEPDTVPIAALGVAMRLHQRQVARALFGDLSFSTGGQILAVA
jgi:HK97 family phage prohead protease